MNRSFQGSAHAADMLPSGNLKAWIESYPGWIAWRGCAPTMNALATSNRTPDTLDCGAENASVLGSHG